MPKELHFYPLTLPPAKIADLGQECHWSKLPLYIKEMPFGTSLVVQQLRLHISNAGGAGSIPGQGTKISHAMQLKKKKRLLWDIRYVTFDLIRPTLRSPSSPLA